MKRIVQRNSSDCEVACVAMLAGVTYEIAAATIFGTQRPSYTTATELREALLTLGRRPAKRFIAFNGRPHTSLCEPALLKVNPRMGDDGWHWVVWSGTSILDPKHPPYVRLRPVSYLTVK